MAPKRKRSIPPARLANPPKRGRNRGVYLQRIQTNLEEETEPGVDSPDARPSIPHRCSLSRLLLSSMLCGATVGQFRTTPRPGCC